MKHLQESQVEKNIIAILHQVAVELKINVRDIKSKDRSFGYAKRIFCAACWEIVGGQKISNLKNLIANSIGVTRANVIYHINRNDEIIRIYPENLQLFGHIVRQCLWRINESNHGNSKFKKLDPNQESKELIKELVIGQNELIEEIYRLRKISGLG
tara:strand:- start:194 stop:661 length:468 start_codon:yes stop_codon:yes gene_type:complete